MHSRDVVKTIQCDSEIIKNAVAFIFVPSGLSRTLFYKFSIHNLFFQEEKEEGQDNDGRYHPGTVRSL